MRNLLKYIVARTYKPMLVRYLSYTSQYRYKNIRLEVPPEVFHPGFFTSTKLLLKHISTLDLANKNFLELGAGSGLIAIYAARRGAQVTASDINYIAVNALKKNKFLNKVAMDIIESDLFEQIPKQYFDVIAINPPYYKKNPASEKEYAWFCGENGEYFSSLFSEIRNYMHEATQVIMVLCDGCDLSMMNGYAIKNGFEMNLVSTSRSPIEHNFIYRIQIANVNY
jgi:release factor glutamine methyltransferase